MPFSVKEQIMKRKSVRTFNGQPLSEEVRNSLEAYIREADDPFGVPITLRLLDAKEHGLSSPVILGETAYLAGKAQRTERFELGFGYRFEKVCLFAGSLGLGTVMLAASLNRAAFKRAMQVGEGEVLPVASPVGVAAAKRSLRESVLRKAVKADERLPFETLFFEGSFGKALAQKAEDPFGQALELVRWAPSAGNKQPWRAVVQGDAVHFYEKKTLGDSPLGDLQQLDVGIALAHFDLAIQEGGGKGRFLLADPGLMAPEKVHYIVSYVKEA